VTTDSQHWLSLPPRQFEFAWCTAAPDAYWTHCAAYPPIDGIIGRSHYLTIVLQKRVRNLRKATRRFLVVRQHRFTTDIAGRCYKGSGELLEQEFV
jgi:hypothetical protein